MYKSNIMEAIRNWNDKHPKLRKKTLGGIASELGISTSALSQIDMSNNFQKHMAVIFSSDLKKRQVELFNLYRNFCLPSIEKFYRIKTILDCEIYDLIVFKE